VSGTVDIRSDRVRFAVDVLGIDLFDHQREALRSDAPVVTIVGGRRSGKTVAAGVAMAHTCMTRRGVQGLLLAPNEGSVRERMRELSAMLAGSALAKEAVLDEGTMTLTFRNGSRIVGLVPTAANIRGRGAGVHAVWVDEAGHVPDSVWTDLRFTLLDHRDDGAQGFITGSPWGDGFFKRAWRLGLDGDPDYGSFGPWTAAMNPRNPRDFLERERSRLNELEARSELDGEWVEDGLQIFPRWLLGRGTADVELGPLLSIGPAARGVLGVDYGLVYDRSAAVGLFRVPVAGLNEDREFRPRFVVAAHVFPQGYELRRVVDDVVGCRSAFRYVGTETVGIGSMPSQELRRRVDGSRPRGMKTTWDLLERDQLLLPREPALLRQLAGLRLEQTYTGAKIGAEDAATHDDVADALSFCMLPFRDRKGRVVCGLRGLAGELAMPDADLPATDAPTVETGSGLRVLREPVLQSVGSRELTLPPALAAHPDFDRQRPRGEMELPVR
jgi:hypothetical protein